MGFGDLAKEAMARALEAYKASVRVEALLDSVQKAVEVFERRIEARLEAQDRKSDAKLETYEKRLREMESRIASLNGKVDGALADAVRIALLDPEIKRRLAESTLKTPQVQVISEHVADGAFHKEPPGA